ncbi:hypothetical protein ACCO45_005873 [Purpureocillium lilacinum]|uniref:Uncharacterized protein n=1 Tax=Purpureocillium lilacinum TaxID=33203 RepID=A0ACC4DWX1_PURLI
MARRVGPTGAASASETVQGGRSKDLADLRLMAAWEPPRSHRGSEEQGRRSRKHPVRLCVGGVSSSRMPWFAWSGPGSPVTFKPKLCTHGDGRIRRCHTSKIASSKGRHSLGSRPGIDEHASEQSRAVLYDESCQFGMSKDRPANRSTIDWPAIR